MIDRQYIAENKEEIMNLLRCKWRGASRKRARARWLDMFVQMCEARTLKLSNDDPRHLRDVCNGDRCKGRCFKDVQLNLL
jgi:hypothetical protein